MGLITFIVNSKDILVHFTNFFLKFQVCLDLIRISLNSHDIHFKNLCSGIIDVYPYPCLLNLILCKIA